MKILLAPVGSHGDVHPFIAVGRTMKRRGHEVVLITSEPFRELAERHGFDFAPTGTADDYEALIHHPDLWHPTKALSVLFAGERPERLLRSAYAQIAAHYERGNTVLLGGTLGLAARIAHEKLGIPFLSVHLQPSAVLSLTDPPAFAMMTIPQWWPMWLRRALFWYADRRVLDPLMAPAVNRLRTDLGLKPIRRIYGPWRHSPQRLLALYPEWYGPARDTPEHLRHVGFVHYDQEEQAVPPAVEAFLQAGPPPVVVSFGSAMRQGGPYFAAAVEALTTLNRRGLILAKSGSQIPANLPATILQADYVPFSAVLPRCAAILHHGGIGTAAQALRAGVPQFLMPMAFDQPDNAVRLEKLGVAVSLPAPRFREPHVSRLLRTLLESPGYRSAASVLQSRWSTEPNPEIAFITEIESSCGKDVSIA